MRAKGLAYRQRRHGTWLQVEFPRLAANASPYPVRVCEAALVQINGKIPKWAYQRGDPFDKDRPLTKNWSEYCCQSPPATSGCASVTPKRQRS